MLITQEHYALMTAFERSHSGRFDREDKSLWSKGVIYQDGRANELFLAYRNGYVHSKADTRSEIENLEAARDGYRDDARALHAALTCVLNNIKDRAEDGVMDISQDVLVIAETALERTNALQGESNAAKMKAQVTEIAKLRDGLERIISLDGQEDNEWDAVERLIPEMMSIARAALSGENNG